MQRMGVLSPPYPYPSSYPFSYHNRYQIFSVPRLESDYSRKMSRRGIGIIRDNIGKREDLVAKEILQLQKRRLRRRRPRNR